MNAKRDENRMRWPELAELKDRYGDDCKLRHAIDAKGEVGMQPVEPEIFWLDGAAYIESQREQPKVRGFKR